MPILWPPPRLPPSRGEAPPAFWRREDRPGPARPRSRRGTSRRGRRSARSDGSRGSDGRPCPGTCTGRAWRMVVGATPRWPMRAVSSRTSRAFREEAGRERRSWPPRRSLVRRGRGAPCRSAGPFRSGCGWRDAEHPRSLRGPVVLLRLVSDERERPVVHPDSSPRQPLYCYRPG